MTRMCVCMYVCMCMHCVCVYTGTSACVLLDIKEYKRIWIPCMGKRRLTVQRSKKGKETELTVTVQKPTVTNNTLCASKATSAVPHWTPTTWMEMDTRSQIANCKQSQQGGDKVEIWSRIWASGPCSQDGLFFGKWEEENQRPKAGQVLKSIQRPETIYNSLRRGDMCAWKKIKQRT